MYAEIKCPQCHAEANVEHIDINQNKAECPSCHHTYSIDIDLQQIRNKVRVLLPENWESTKSINHVDLSIPWKTNSPAVFEKVRACFEKIAIIPSIIAIIFMIFWTVGFTKQSLERNDTLNLIVGLVFAAGGIGLLLWIFFVAKKRAHTLIQIDEENLRITLPILSQNDEGKTQFPIKNNSVLAKSRIKQLYVIKNGHYYSLIILDNSNTLHDSLYPFFNLDHALYIEQSIEDLLAIKDVSVSDEIKL